MTKYALNNPGVILFFFALVLLLGISSIFQIPKEENPRFPSWAAIIITNMPGASPLKMEELITEKIEEKVESIEELKTIKSTSQTGVSYVTLIAKDSIEITKPIWDKVREKLSELEGTLPQGASLPFLNTDFGKEKSISIAITGQGFTNKELTDIAKDFKKDIRQLRYVSRVDIIGIQAERIFMEASDAKLTELGISGQLLRQILVQQNIVAPGGQIQVGPQQISLEPTGEYTSVVDIGKTIITLPGHKSSIFLKDIFTIKRKYIDPPKMQMRFMGKDAVGIVIEMQDNGQILELGQKVKALVERKQEELLIGVDLDIFDFQPFWVQRSIFNFSTNLWQAIVIVALFMMLLLGWREGLIVGTLIPFAFFLTLILMVLFGQTINQVTIAGLIIALGMLVDNGIVMTESIAGYIKEGMTNSAAAIKSGKELTIPLLTSTATTVAAFLPIALAQSTVGIFCRGITYVVAMVLLSSFLVSMTLIPLMCVKMLQPKKAGITRKSRLGAGYAALMQRCLQHKYFTILIVIIVFFTGMQLSVYIKSIFFPSSDRFQFVVDFNLPRGTAFKTTKARVLEAEAYIMKKYPDLIKNMGIYIGAGGVRFGGGTGERQQADNYAEFVINCTNMAATDKMDRELKTYFENNFEDARAIVKRLENGPPVGTPVQVEVYGKDFKKLYLYARQVQAIAESIPGATDIRDDWGAFIPKLSIVVNQDRARRIGVSSRTIADGLSAGLSGTMATEYREGDSIIPVIYRAIEKERTSLQKLQTASIPTSQGGTIPLLQVANLELKWASGVVKHKNRHRTIVIEGDTDGSRSVAEITDDIQTRIKKEIDFSPGYGVKFAGEGQESAEAQESITDKLPPAMALLVMILVAQFANVRKMVMILFTIPLSFLGIILGLLSTGYAFGFMAFLGVISLAGIVVNNAILLIEQIDVNLKAGKKSMDAIISAGQRRAFPIILTTLTTLSGLMPLAWSGDMWGPMAVTIMGGLVISTILTLVVIPVLYAIFFRVILDI